MKKNRILALTGAACLSVALLAGCGSNNNTDPSANSADNGDASALSGKVATGGSTSMQKLMSMLQEDFMAKNNGVTVSYDPTGSGAGITGASDGSLDIGLSSRVLHDDETDVEAITVCLDGIAVVVNNANGVEDLSLEQLAGIFSGEITNWSEVGGVDEPITAFQRNENAGSQTMMKKLVMDGLDMMEPEKEYVIGEMGALIEAVRGYDNSAGAIGYTVYYYAKNMNMADGLKILRIDDVPPGAESFRSGAYPFLNPYYVVMAADTPEDSPVAVLYRWILSDAGQYLVDREGYVAVRDVEESA